MPGARAHLLTTAGIVGPPLVWLAAGATAGLPVDPELAAVTGERGGRILAGGALVAAGLLAAGAGGLWPNVDHVLPRPDRAPQRGPPDEPEPFPEAAAAAPVPPRGRGWAHTLLACLVWSWLTGQAIDLTLGALGSRAGSAGPVLALLFGAGYLLHLGLDARTPGGVPFWAGTRRLGRAVGFGVRLALWPLWFVVPGLNPFARPDGVEIRVETREPVEGPVPPPGASSASPPAETLPQAVRCPRCGTGHHPAAAFCQVCGAALRLGAPGALERPTR